VRNDFHTCIDFKQSIFFKCDTSDSPREPRKSDGAQPFIKLKGLWLTKILYAYPLLPRRELPFGSALQFPKHAFKKLEISRREKMKGC